MTTQQSTTGTADTETGTMTTPDTDQNHRHLVIRVTEAGKPTTNIRIPMKLARTAAKFIPAKAKENLREQGIDVEQILAELTGDEQGPLVQVDQEGKSVLVSVE